MESSDYTHLWDCSMKKCSRVNVNVLAQCWELDSMNIQWCIRSLSGLYMEFQVENGIMGKSEVILTGADTPLSMNPCPFLMEFIGLMWKIGKFDAIHDFRKVDFKSFQHITYLIGLIVLKLAKLSANMIK